MAFKRTQVLLAGVIAVAIASAGVLWSRRDVPTGVSAETPARIDLEVSRFLLGTESDYKVSVTNLTDCAAIIQALSLGRKVRPDHCVSLGTMTVHYSSGTSNEIRLSPGHDDGRFEFTLNGVHSISRTRFAEAVSKAGVDKSKLLLGN